MNTKERRILIIVAIVLIIAIACCAFFLIRHNSSKEQYLSARSLLAKGYYTSAADAFDAAGNYEDAKQYSAYCSALAAGENGDYDTAIEQLTAMEGFSDSAVQAKYYTARQLEAKDEDEESMTKALALYQDIGDFSDSAERANVLMEVLHLNQTPEEQPAATVQPAASTDLPELEEFVPFTGDLQEEEVTEDTDEADSDTADVEAVEPAQQENTEAEAAPETEQPADEARVSEAEATSTPAVTDDDIAVPETTTETDKNEKTEATAEPEANAETEAAAEAEATEETEMTAKSETAADIEAAAEPEETAETTEAADESAETAETTEAADESAETVEAAEETEAEPTETPAAEMSPASGKEQDVTAENAPETDNDDQKLVVPEKPIDGKVEGVTIANIRAEASTDAAILGGLVDGEQVTIENINNGWAKVKTSGGVEGYVSANFLNYDARELENAPDAVNAVVDAEPVLYVRTAPDQSAELIRYLPDNTEVLVLEHTDNGWAKIYYNGYRGYVNADYLVEK